MKDDDDELMVPPEGEILVEEQIPDWLTPRGNPEGILHLSKSIPVPLRQNFSVKVEFSPFRPEVPVPPATHTPSSNRTLAKFKNTGVPWPAPEPEVPLAPMLEALEFVNKFDGLKMIQTAVDGVKTRDVS